MLQRAGEIDDDDDDDDDKGEASFIHRAYAIPLAKVSSGNPRVAPSGCRELQTAT